MSLFSNLKDKFSQKGQTLYFPGCTTDQCLNEVSDKYREILTDIGVNHTVIKELKCCGNPLLNAGYKEDFEEIKKHNKKILKQKNIKEIITSAPHCMETLNKHYGIKTKHISQVLNKERHKLIRNHDEEIGYQDSCILAKNNIIEEPRNVLKKTGMRINEPKRTKKEVFCCGASGGLPQNSPQLANKICKERLKHFKTKKIVTSCPYCYLHMKENSKDKKILEMSEIINP